jgi:RimJ/RimL family protein N-acetyltransferase
MITPERTWETTRLVARPAAAEDAQVVFDQYARDPAVAKYMTWTPHRTVEETVQFLTRCERSWSEGSAFPWTLWLRKEHAFVGLIEVPHRRDQCGPWVCLGPTLVAARADDGGADAVVEWALAQPTIYRVWATCDIENTASARLLERVGMEREGVLRRWLVDPNISTKPRDSLCYSIVKAG